MIKFILITAILAFIFYSLYTHGLLIMNAKRAVMYVGRRRGKNASFTSCDGYVKRVVRFQESKKYQFELKADISKGDYWIIVEKKFYA